MNNIITQYTKKELQNIATSLGLSKWGTKLQIYSRIQDKSENNNENQTKEFYVLIMCQRKYTANSDDAKIATYLVEDFVYNKLRLYNINLKIEYLVDKQPCNHCIQLGTNSQEVIKYVSNNKNKYDLVLFYTCPLPFMMEANGTNKLLYEQLKTITKHNGLYLFGYHKGITNFNSVYRIWRNRKNQRFNFEIVNGFSLPVYKLK